MATPNKQSKLTAAGLLVTLGIIYGDIGTSPLYVMKAIVGDRIITDDLIIGSVSCVFWTLTLITTIKYVILTLNADNNGEGGIFSLYALVRKSKIKWLAFPAIIGGSALLADGLITPSISVSAAIEGLRNYNAGIPTIPIVIGILFGLFFIQQFGTSHIGKFFGPLMLIWFAMLSILGVSMILTNVEILKAFNPYYAINLLVNYEYGFVLLGAVFLCTSGAEALYTDLGHCGKRNIRASWIFVKISLLLNYFGQGAWLLNKSESTLDGNNPFFSIMPSWFLLPGIFIATIAAVVASHALIKATFTLVNEAVRLDFGPKLKINFPTEIRGQIFIPTVNWIMCFGSIGMVLYFKESSGMENAYGLSIILAMMMDTLLFSIFLYIKRTPVFLIGLFLLIFFGIENSFLIANLNKFLHGGWVTLLITCFLVWNMYSWNKARKIRNKFVEFVKLKDYLKTLSELSFDISIPKYATHLVYLTSSKSFEDIESKIIYSIFQKQPKRADIYWFVHVDVVDEPYAMSYEVHEIINDKVIRINFKLGFRIEPRINIFYRKAVRELVENNEVDIMSRYSSLSKNNVIGDFRFIVIEKYISNENDFNFYQRIVLGSYSLLKLFALNEGKAFGLDTSLVTIEKVPLLLNPVREIDLKRVY